MSAGREIPFRPDIQGLRAIAIAVVVLAHAQVPGFSGGFVGVDIFFVLSGFLITGLLVKERLGSGTIRYGRFLARRLRRLLPALLVMLVAVLFLALTLLSAFEAQMQTGSFLYSVTWTSNFYFAFAEFDYFSALKAKDLFLHTWSLGIEEQFYVAWPWLVALAFALAAGNSKPDRHFRSMSIVIGAVFVAGLGLCVYWAQAEPLLSFYMMPSRGWQFALGAAVFLYAQRASLGREASADPRHPVGFRRVAGAAGLALILGSTLLLHDKLNYPGGYALLPSVGTALLIYAGSGRGRSPVTAALASRPFVWLGDRSYSLYLWHWPVLILGAAFGLADSAAGTIGLMVMAILLAAVSYRWIELPFWKGRFSVAPPRLVTLASALALVGALGLSQSLSAVAFDGSARSADHGVADPRADAPEVFATNLDCDSWYFSAEVVPCATGNADALHTAVLIGDSIGTQWASMLPEIYRQPDWRVVVLAKSACAIADVEYYYKPAGGTYDVCTEWRNNSIAYLETLQPDIVFIGSSSGQDFSESEWVEGTRRVLAKLAASARQVVIIPGTPSLSFDGPSCLREPYRFTSRLRDSQYICEEAQASGTSDEVAVYLELAASGLPNARVLNLNDLVCPDRRCAARSPDGIAVFRDDQHLTATFVAAQAATVRARLDSFGVGPANLQTTVASVPIDR